MTLLFRNTKLSNGKDSTVVPNRSDSVKSP
jgi:hypothetical protein